jgi:SAM-dependent methyltransferase
MKTSHEPRRAGSRTLLGMSERHQAHILDQFTLQAVPFSNAPSIRDAAALAALVAASGTERADLVLDVACGPGLVVKAFAAVAAHVTGVDLTPAMIERAREHTGDCPNVTLLSADVTTLPFADASFSIVASRFAFHHFLEPARVLSEMLRVCTPGGRVVVQDLIAADEPREAEAFHRLELQRDPSHARALPLSELEGLFDAQKLQRRPTLHSHLPFELESLLARSFPPAISRDELRALYLAGLNPEAESCGAGPAAAAETKNPLGLALRRTEHGIVGAYRVATIFADRC